MMAVIVGTPVILALSVLDIWYYGKTGKSVLHLHPYLDILIWLGAFGLFVMAVVIRISYYFNQKNQ
jgi:hypothetical protein